MTDRVAAMTRLLITATRQQRALAFLLITLAPVAVTGALDPSIIAR